MIKLDLEEIKKELDFIEKRFRILDSNNAIESQEIDQLFCRLESVGYQIKLHSKESKRAHLKLVT